jgi:hypothetical protein
VAGVARREPPHRGGGRPGAQRRAPPARSAADEPGRGPAAGAGRSHPGAARLRKLIVNAIDALRGAREGAHALPITSGIHASQGVRVMGCDRGIGLVAERFEHLFTIFHRRDDRPTPVETFRYGLAVSSLQPSPSALLTCGQGWRQSTMGAGHRAGSNVGTEIA